MGKEAEEEQVAILGRGLDIHATVADIVLPLLQGATTLPLPALVRIHDREGGVHVQGHQYDRGDAIRDVHHHDRDRQQDLSHGLGHGHGLDLDLDLAPRVHGPHDEAQEGKGTDHQNRAGTPHMDVVLIANGDERRNAKMTMTNPLSVIDGMPQRFMFSNPLYKAHVSQ